MRKLSVFNNVSLDGYFVDGSGEMGWAHGAPDAEFGAFVAGNARGEGEFLFGRITYEMMAAFWPTEQAIRNMPLVAGPMNARPKTVFSRTMKRATWNNTTLVRGDAVAAVRRIKRSPGPDLVMFGSGTVVAQLADKGLIDEYQFVLIPVVLGKGRTQFEGLRRKLALKLTKSRTFPSGKVFLCYQPEAS